MTNRTACRAVLPLLVSIVACGGEPDGGAAAAAGGEFCAQAMANVDAYMSTLHGPDGERYGGTVVVGTIGEMPDGMKALVSSDYSSSQHQMFVHLMTVVRMNERYEMEPYLARSWVWNDDMTEVTFHMRDDVFWHDGVKTTAYDVAFTYERATDPETTFPNAAYWTHYEKGSAGVEVVDSFTVKLRMRPHAEPLDPWRATAIMPVHLLGDVPPAELRQHPYGERCPVGNGPFRFVEHRQSERWAFEANPAFPEELGGRPYVDRYVYRVIPEQTTLLSDLLTENIDVFIAPRPEQVQQILDSDHLELMSFPFRSYIYVGWNTRRPQLADTPVRRAITMATNRDEMVEALLLGYGSRADHGVPSFHWAYADQVEGALGYDPEGAKRLLDDAGWIDEDGDGVREKDGTRLSFSIKYNNGNQQRQDVAEIMQAQLSEVGIEVRPQVVEWATMLSQIESKEREFDGVVMGWITEFRMGRHGPLPLRQGGRAISVLRHRGPQARSAPRHSTAHPRARGGDPSLGRSSRSASSSSTRTPTSSSLRGWKASTIASRT